MITTYLLKTTAVFITIIILWCIAKRQEELGNEIEDNAKKVDLLRGELFQSEISFNQKKLAEEKRMNEDTNHFKKIIIKGVKDGKIPKSSLQLLTPKTTKNKSVK